ncbi:hypothetical protein CD30_17420 [Ureibacillus massiliensis 4400831 = CIP 108448 = CCUG 49529]|uniref:TniQ domain-containing protein n=1 Tax=Ureibacillus massiliensis 4400831 = CIP 108448 = CCUG 49529 TaxID=1211035 RepID=A0A0A3J0U1_9BACL|nr:TniQ family protein [Ureibacillus massiliensis]KGR89285.1 hypothetical protein CD30_17420 [Ureibacillus massiliensis 4400831 = CIP 108448 = CCUG 49529]
METQFLTIRVRPYKDELLSSFLKRLAYANGFDVLKFCSSFSISNSHYLQKSDLDLVDFYPLNVLDIRKVAELNNLDKMDLLNKTFFKVIKKFTTENFSRVRNFTDLIRKKLNYCPDCLKENNYYRVLWKVEDVNGCLKHNRLLLDKCQNCYKDIFYKEVDYIGLCPHCNFALKNSKIILDKNVEVEINTHVIKSWEFLLGENALSIDIDQIPLRLLYLLNEFKIELDRNLVTKNLNKYTSLPTLLQHVRGTNGRRKNLHMSIVLNILQERNFSLEQLCNLEIPDIFITGLLPKRKIENVSCMAPWCSSFGKVGSLVKTGTSKKKKNDGTELKYYLLCTKCGCEYAFNYDDQLVERTYFIHAYNELITINTSNSSLKQLASSLKISIDKTKRCLCYFISRNVLNNCAFSKDFIIDSNKFKKILNGIRKDVGLKKIRKWNIWESYNEFLIYRYHIDVINELHIKGNYSNRIDNIPNDNSQFLLVKNTVDNMFEKNEEITIKNVCTKLKVSPETIRNWGGNKYISKVKRQQRELRLNRLREEIKNKVELYIIETHSENISSKGLYEYLKIGRTVLWRIDKELTRFIADKLGTQKEPIISQYKD